MSTGTIPDLLAALVAGDSSRPLVTFYDDATGERVELSVKSFDNWVAKTANLLQDGLSAQPGETVAIALPTHWQGMVWLCAAWSCGLVAVLDGAPGTVADFAVVGPQLPAIEGGATVALSLRPLGASFDRELPAEVLDYAAEVAGFGDVFRPIAPVEPDFPAVVSGDATLTQSELVARGEQVAAALELGAAPRLLTDANPCSGDGVGTAVLAPLVTGGSVVLVRHPDPARETVRVSQEQVSARALGSSDNR